MSWLRLGQVYDGHGDREHLVSHASVPFAEPLANGLHRIWFSPRDVQNRSHIAWLIIDLRQPQTVLDMGAVASLAPGPLGAFDDCGAMMSWLVHTGTERRLYYIGWNTRATVPFHVSIGAAAPQTDTTWMRVAGPLLDRSIEDPWFCSNPCVIHDAGGWRMWYLSGLGWEGTGGLRSPSYHICHAISQDGLSWSSRGRVVVPLVHDEYALARPSVLKDDGGYTMWFCARTRHRPYRLCAARSVDGLVWRRAPELAGLEPMPGAWDSDMIAYPHVFEHAGRRWMLYCGNGFGRTGFGVAVWNP